MNLISIDSMSRLLSYRAIRRYVVLVALISIFSPNLALTNEGKGTDGIVDQEAISRQGGCEAVCRLPDQARTVTE